MFKLNVEALKARVHVLLIAYMVIGQCRSRQASLLYPRSRLRLDSAIGQYKVFHVSDGEELIYALR